ncbi:MAG: GNAT family N-acetyltransferase [Clostridia bacterium]|nr:GNAT family N-acetyltransferase [Clostridia bacterium]
MMIRCLEAGDREVAKSLWVHRFPDDPPSFVDWFFENRFNEQYSFGAFEGSELLSVSHGTKMQVRVRDRIIPALMISGVATREGFEGRKLMTSVIRTQMKNAVESGISLAFNKPANPAVYGSLGFTFCSETCFIEGASFRGDSDMEFHWDNGRAFDIYTEATKGYSGCVVRDYSDFCLKVSDYRSDNAAFFMTEQGYCVYYRNEDGAYIEEALSLGSYKRLLTSLYQKFDCPLFGKLPPDCDVEGKRVPMNLYAILNRNALAEEIPIPLEIAALPDKELIAELFGYKREASILPPRTCFCIDEY